MANTPATKASPATPRKDKTQFNKKKAWKHIETPTKERILSLYHYNGRSQNQIRLVLKADYKIDLLQARISKIIKENSPRTAKNRPDRVDKRGKKRKFSEAEMDNIEATMDTYPDIR